jgi:hypothetical protein
MSDQIHVLAQQLLGKPSVEDCDLQDIKNLVQQYPYFAPAQFLLLEKLKREAAPDYPSQLQRAVLYYHNPLEFEYFISSDKFYATPHEESSLIHEEQTETVVLPEADPEYLPHGEPEMVNVMEPPAVLEQNEISPNEEPLVSPESAPVFEMKQQQVEQKEEVLAFEPFHTVDYFASQGIRFVQEEAPKDKFGKQLKSFTEWLKTMKRLPVQEAAKNIDPSTESNVQHLADDSIHESEVVTEAMAEVWLKQGNRQKALEVYNKLSLLNPSKNAYFAAKIEDLKRS